MKGWRHMQHIHGKDLSIGTFEHWTVSAKSRAECARTHVLVLTILCNLLASYCQTVNQRYPPTCMSVTNIKASHIGWDEAQGIGDVSGYK